MSKEAFKAWYKSEYGIEPCTVENDELFQSPTWKAWQHLSTAITQQQEEIERLKGDIESVQELMDSQHRSLLLVEAQREEWKNIALREGSIDEKELTEYVQNEAEQAIIQRGK